MFLASTQFVSSRSPTSTQNRPFLSVDYIPPLCFTCLSDPILLYLDAFHVFNFGNCTVSWDADLTVPQMSNIMHNHPFYSFTS